MKVWVIKDTTWDDGIDFTLVESESVAIALCDEWHKDIYGKSLVWEHGAAYYDAETGDPLSADDADAENWYAIEERTVITAKELENNFAPL